MRCSCNRKRIAQVTDNRSGKIVTCGAIVLKRADSENVGHILCLDAGVAGRKRHILMPASGAVLSLSFLPTVPSLRHET